MQSHVTCAVMSKVTYIYCLHVQSKVQKLTQSHTQSHMHSYIHIRSHIRSHILNDIIYAVTFTLFSPQVYVMRLEDHIDNEVKSVNELIHFLDLRKYCPAS